MRPRVPGPRTINRQLPLPHDEIKIAESHNEIALRRIRQDFLKSLGRFVAPAAQQEMTHGVLQSEELEKLTKLHFTEYESASQEIMKLDTLIEDDQRQLAKLEQERKKLAAGPPVTYDAVICFGVDGQLRARRTVVDRKDSVQGGNRSVELTCEIVVDNYKEQPVNVRIRERTPHTEDATSLRVSVGESSHDLSTDPDYQRFERYKGLLLWDLPVKPGAGEKATTLRYSYALEFDKNMTLQDISGEQKTRLRTEFIESSKASIRK